MQQVSLRQGLEQQQRQRRRWVSQQRREQRKIGRRCAWTRSRDSVQGHDRLDQAAFLQGQTRPMQTMPQQRLVVQRSVVDQA